MNQDEGLDHEHVNRCWRRLKDAKAFFPCWKWDIIPRIVTQPYLTEGHPEPPASLFPRKRLTNVIHVVLLTSHDNTILILILL